MSLSWGFSKMAPSPSPPFSTPRPQHPLSAPSSPSSPLVCINHTVSPHGLLCHLSVPSPRKNPKAKCSVRLETTDREPRSASQDSGLGEAALESSAHPLT